MGLKCDIHPSRDMVLHLERADGVCFNMCLTAELDALISSARGSIAGSYDLLDCGHNDTTPNGTWHQTAVFKDAAERVGLCERCFHRVHGSQCRVNASEDEGQYCGCIFITIARAASVPDSTVKGIRTHAQPAIISTDSSKTPRERLNDALLQVLFCVMDVRAEDRANARYDHWLSVVTTWLREAINGTNVTGH